MNTESLRVYLLDRTESLAPLEFVALVPSGAPLHVVEIGRSEEGELQVRVPGRPPMAPELPPETIRRLKERGLASEDETDRGKPWLFDVAETKTALDLAFSLLNEVFEAAPNQTIDVLNGSHKREHEARRKLAEIRERLEPLLAEIIDGEPKQDPDGDFQLPIADVQVTVAPRALPGGPLAIRIFAVTNVGFAMTPEVGLLLARLNFGLMFGRFALDAEHNAIWFDETLLGEEFTDEGLRFAVQVVAETADEWDDRLKQMFGGATYQEVLAKDSAASAPPVKPGEGRGLYL